MTNLEEPLRWRLKEGIKRILYGVPSARSQGTAKTDAENSMGNRKIRTKIGTSKVLNNEDRHIPTWSSQVL